MVAHRPTDDLAGCQVEHRGGQFGSYLAPGFEDLPQLDTIIIENPSADGPYGAKGIGEMANNAQPPAIARISQEIATSRRREVARSVSRCMPKGYVPAGGVGSRMDRPATPRGRRRPQAG